MKGAFICLPRAALSDKRLGFEDLRVLLALWSWRGKSYTVHPTLAMIAERARVSAKHISGVTTKLARLGYIVKTGNGGRGQHVRYTLLEPETSPDSGEVYGETSPDSGEVYEVEARPSTDGKTSPDSGDELQNVPRFRGGLEQNVPRSGGETSPASGDPIKETSLRQESAKADVPPISPAQPDGFALEAKPAKRKRNSIPEVDMPDGLGIDAEEWAELLMVCRKKGKPLTRIRWNRMVRNAADAGMKPHEVVSLCAGEGWASFNPEYNSKPQQNGAQQNVRQFKTAREIDEENAAEWYRGGLKRNAGAFIGEPAIIREQSKLGESNGTSQLQLAG